MVETQNKKVISKLAARSFKVNRFRNRIAILAIALTAVLFTTIATIGISLANMMFQENARMSGGNSDVNIKKLTAEEAKRIEGHPLVKEYGYSEILGFGANEEYAKTKVEVRAANEAFAERFFCKPATGTMPQSIDEIAMDTNLLDALGIPHEIGAKVSFQYDIGLGGEQAVIRSDEFTLCGFWEGDSAMPSSEVWVFDDYIEQVLVENQIDYPANRDKEALTSLTGMYHVSFMVDNKFMADAHAEQIMKDCKIPDTIRASVNTMFTQLKLMPFSTYLIAVMGILSIIFIGYLLIYNIFQISIVRDIRFYGMLKTIGTTGGQIKSIIRKQALMLSVIGIPLGIVCGYGIAMVLVPFISDSSRFTFEVSFHPAIFLLAAAFALLTVVISCRKPAKMAAMVSPIEALRFAEQGKTKKNKKGTVTTQGGKIWRMALRNIGRNKKKTILVMISLCLSLSIFNYIFIDTKSFDLEKFISQVAVSDFYMADADYLEPLSTYNPKADTINKDLMAYINEQPGVEGSGRIFASEVFIEQMEEKNTNGMVKWLKSLKELDIYKNDPSIDKTVKSLEEKKEAYMNLYGYDPYIFSKMQVYKGEIDEEKLNSGNYVIIEAKRDDYGKWTAFYDVGDKILIQGKEYEILASAQVDRKLTDVEQKIEGGSTEHGQGTVGNIYIPAAVYESINPNTNPIAAIADVAEEARSAMKEALISYRDETSPNLVLESMDDYLEEFQSTKQMNEVVGYTLSGVLAFIGILNFLNTTVTSIFARKKELAMMQSVGMTGSQLKKMLLLEGIFYVGAAVIFMTIVGNLVVYLAIASDFGGYKTYHFSAIPIIFSVLVLGAAAVVIPMGSYGILSRMSIVERLREAE